MKYLLVINSLDIGGAETLITNLAVQLNNKDNIECDVLTLKDSNTFLKNKLLNHGVNIYSLKAINIYSVFNILRLYKYLRNYDIVNVHLFPSLYWVAMCKIIFRFKAKIVYTEHSTHNRRRNIFLFKFLDNLIYSRYKAIVTVSDMTKNNLLNHIKFPLEKIITIKNSIDVKLFHDAIPSNKTDFGFLEDDYIITMVARFYYPKDHSTVINSLKYLPGNFKVLFVGTGDLQQKIITETNELGFNDRVVFAGECSNIPSILKMSDIIVMSSLYEGLSLSSIEGMAVGRPFIASNSPGLVEVVEGAGLLFEKSNALDLANKINLCFSDPSYSREIAKSCYGHARKFDVEEMVNEYVKFYENLLQ